MALITSREAIKRLIVLVPDCLAGNPKLAQKVYWMAFQEACDVVFLTIVDQDADVMSKRRSMATMVAITSGERVRASSKLTIASEWLNTLQGIYQPGDEIVCQEEQLVKTGFMRTIPLKGFLFDRFKAPIRTISGLYSPEKEQVKNWGRKIILWMGLFAILVGFLLLEFRINQMVHGTIGVLLFLAVFTVEISTILIWLNNWDHKI